MLIILEQIIWSGLSQWLCRHNVPTSDVIGEWWATRASLAYSFMHVTRNVLINSCFTAFTIIYWRLHNCYVILLFAAVSREQKPVKAEQKPVKAEQKPVKASPSQKAFIKEKKRQDRLMARQAKKDELKRKADEDRAKKKEVHDYSHQWHWWVWL